MYADDTLIYTHGKNANSDVDTLNKELKEVDVWLHDNKLALNAKKCEFLMIGSRKRIKQASVPSVYIGQKQIQRVRKCKYLGVMLDEHLDWTAQTESLIKKVNKDIYLLKRIKAFINQKVALVFYKSVIQSKFDYCDIIWGTMGLGLKNRIQKLQNRALRTVMGVNFEFPTEYLYRDLKMDKLETRRKKRTLYVMYKIAHEMLPHYL